jgi:hypothetical protein
VRDLAQQLGGDGDRRQPPEQHDSVAAEGRGHDNAILSPSPRISLASTKKA